MEFPVNTNFGRGQPILVNANLTADKLTLSINRDVKVNHVECDGEQINDFDPGSNTVNTIEQNGAILGTMDHEGHVSMSNMALISTLADFLGCSDAVTHGCFGGTGMFAERGPLDPSKAVKKPVPAILSRSTAFPEFQFLSQELKDMVLSEMAGPHTVTLYMCQNQSIVAMDRKWADIPLYHVCHDFRQYAIQKFGIPKKDRFPFDPKNDTLYMRFLDRPYMAGTLLRTDHRPKLPILDVTMALNSTHGHDPELWDRIQTVESESRMHSFRYGIPIPHGNHVVFHKVHTWRILVTQLDSCRYLDWFDATTMYLIHRDDMAVLQGVFKCLTSLPRATQSWWRPKTIEICRKGHMCGALRMLEWMDTRFLIPSPPERMCLLNKERLHKAYKGTRAGVS